MGGSKIDGKAGNLINGLIRYARKEDADMTLICSKASAIVRLVGDAGLQKGLEQKMAPGWLIKKIADSKSLAGARRK